jgi:hypothetical protein
MKTNIIKGIFIIFGALVFVFLVGSLFGSQNAEEFSSLTAQAKSKISFWLAPAHAKEVMNMTDCYCGCGGGMKISECTCEHGEEMGKFIKKEARGKSKDDLLVAVAKKYGLKNIRDEKEQKRMKELIIAKAGPNRPQIIIEPKEVNFGKVKIFGGKVITKFKVTNNGKDDLIINKIETSCMCTEAAMVYNSNKSPKFGMEMEGHAYEDASAANWSERISGGQSGEIEVEFDPLVHGPDATGLVRRAVIIKSNDLLNPEIEFEFEADVVK